MQRRMPEIGETFFRLTDVAFAGKDARNNVKAVFRCACGIEKVLRVGKVRSGEIKSCGCTPVSIARQQGNTNADRKAFGAYRYNGLDRLDNNKGYIPGNVVPCCDYCNTMKNDQTLEQFLTRVRTIAARFPEGA